MVRDIQAYIQVDHHNYNFPDTLSALFARIGTINNDD